MKVLFFKRDSRWDEPVCEAFCAGVSIFAHKAEVKPSSESSILKDAEGASVAVFAGITSLAMSSQIFETLRQNGVRLLFLDKGHMGRGEYVRVSIDQFKPLHYITKMTAPSDRLRKLQDKHALANVPMRKDGEHIVFAGSSNKYTEILGLGNATAYAQTVIGDIMRRSSRQVVYRPKPSWAGEAVPIDGTFFSRPPRTLSQELDGAYCLVTHGSNAGVDALLAGIPVITLGDGVSRPLSRTSVADIDDLYYPSDEEKLQWLSNVAYCQWSLSEFRSGEAWETISDQLKRY